MERTITGYHQYDQGDWAAELSCGHDQHVRHRPPFQLRAWVVEPDGRAQRLGKPINCPLCDRAELPDGLHLARSSREWSEDTVPAGLLRGHRVATGTWGRIVVHEGRLRFVAATNPRIDVVLAPGSSQAIPPEVEHEVSMLGPVRFRIDFLAVDDRYRPVAAHDAKPAASFTPMADDEGGDPACWAGLLCPECGAVLDGSPHAPNCQGTK